MAERHLYRKRAGSTVTAVQLDLETTGFTYHKWGGTQTCKRGDWIVNNDGEVYTVDQDSFAKTYAMVSPGVYQKVTPVWAEIAVTAGHVETREGTSEYSAGDYLVSNDPDGIDVWAIKAGPFESMYELAPD